MNNWVVGNWKMHGSLAACRAFVPALLSGLPEGWARSGVQIGVCPPHPYLAVMQELMADTSLHLGAQKVHPAPAGAYTGDIAPSMLQEFGVSLCIVGHSEHRQYRGVSNAYCAQSLHGLLAVDIVPVLCVGETLDEREGGRQQEIVRQQLLEAFQASGASSAGRRRSDVPLVQHEALTAPEAARLIVAYEPVWAIGTGRTATPEQANEMHAFIRELLGEEFGTDVSGGIPLLYGGSVNPGNAAALMAQPDINGTLVGGASLKPDSFLSIIEQSLN